MARQVPGRFTLPSPELAPAVPVGVSTEYTERLEDDRRKRAWDRLKRWRSMHLYDVLPSVFGVKKSELAIFSRQLATFIAAGVPLTDAISVLRQETRSQQLRAALAAIESELRQGASVSDAFGRFPQIFSGLYLNLVRSAELTGTLDTVLKRLDVQLTREDRAEREIRAAMSYPAVILLLAAGSLGVMIVYVLPRFVVLLAEFNAQLPLATRILLGVARFVTDNAVGLLLGLAALVAGFVASQRGETGRRIRDGLLLRMPVVGALIRYGSVARFCRTLGIMLEAGVPVTRSMDVVMSSVSNRVLARRLQPVRASMLAGEGFAGPLSRTGVFPPTVIQMLRVGEETGALERFLADAADYYENELEYKLQSAVQLLEPALLLAVGAVIAFVAISLVSAIYALTAAIR